jgi:hypothetical protein
MLWFTNKKPVVAEPPMAAPPSAASPSAARPPTAVDHRDMVTLTLKKVLRTYGVPPHWIDSELLPIDTSARGAQFRLILTMNHWNAQLVRYTLTLQQNLQHALAMNLTQFEPIKFHICWAFAPACIPPTLEVPAAASWLKRHPAEEQVGDLFDRRKAPRSPQDAPRRPLKGEVRIHVNGNQEGGGFDKTAIAPFPFP